MIERLDVKLVILAGGKGTRMEEATFLKPKPLIEIGGKPILWHIMKMYSEKWPLPFLFLYPQQV